MNELAYALAKALLRPRFDLSSEKACQAEIHPWLQAQFPDREILREHRLSPRDIPDFFVAGVAIEIKMNIARPAAIEEQLGRYAAYPEVQALVLASNRAVFMPYQIGGKTMLTVSLGSAWL